MEMPMIYLILTLFSLALINAEQKLKGPPKLSRQDVKEIHGNGETFKIVCPVEGFPEPIFEWSKDGEYINDFSWPRYRPKKNYLKIKSADLDDSGVYECKGVNGFGSMQAQIQLIITDLEKQSKNQDYKSKDNYEVAPPIFSGKTRSAPLYYTKHVGEEFQLACESLGSPEPSIVWLKNGRKLERPIVTEAKGGRVSIIKLLVMGTDDAGLYTCKATNLVGESSQNYTLIVNPSTSVDNVMSAHQPSSLLAKAYLEKETVMEDQSSNFHCDVTASYQPQIIWLKKLDELPDKYSGPEEDDTNVLVVDKQRYRLLQSSGDLKLGNDRYTSKLDLFHTKISDAGIYICFVRNGGITYKSVELKVLKDNQRDVLTSVTESKSDGPVNEVTILVICIAVFFSMGAIVAAGICITVRRRSKCSESQTTETHGAESPDLQYPFMQNERVSSLTMTTAATDSSKFDHLIAAPLLARSHQNQYQNPWSTHTVYPALNQAPLPTSFGYLRQGRPNHLPISTTTTTSTTNSFPNQSSSTKGPRHSSVGPSHRQPLLDHFCDNNFEHFTNQYEVPFVYNLNRINGKPSQVDGRQSRLIFHNSLHHQNSNINNNNINTGVIQKQQRGYLTYHDDF